MMVPKIPNRISGEIHSLAQAYFQTCYLTAKDLIALGKVMELVAANGINI